MMRWIDLRSDTVTSPTPEMRQAMGEDFLLVTPGIRPPDAAGDDQRRIQTPAQALADGSNYLVIGRPVTQAADPAAALGEILTQIPH